MTVRTTTKIAAPVGPSSLRRERCGAPWCAVIVIAAAAIGFVLAVLGLMELWSGITSAAGSVSLPLS